VSDEMHTTREGWLNYPPLRNALVAGLIALTAFLLETGSRISHETARWFYWAAIPLGAYLWAWEGVEELLRERVVGISMLMLAAAAGAGYLGMWDEAAALVVLYGAAEGIEEYTFKKTRGAIRALLDLAPKEARLLRDGETHSVPAENLDVGDRFLVLPGESVPTDGVVVEGESTVDEAAVTGEAEPVEKSIGDKVFAATINGAAALTVEATKRFADNTLSRIIDLVENAQEQKGRAQEWMERFGRRYSPLVLLTALVLLIVGIANAAERAYWIEKAVILLVAAAPCALVISLPITMAAGISGSAKRGILIKGGAHLEHLGTIRVIAFDKTGTLTHGRPRVTDVILLDGTESDLVRIAAALERYFTHPLAKAVVDYAAEKGIEPPEADDTRAILGSGVQGVVGGRLWKLGSPRMFERMGIPMASERERIESLQSDGKTVILLGSEEGVVGVLALRDSLRENAVAVIQELHDLGIATAMLTGDNPRTAERVARELGIDEVRASLKPEDKVHAVQELMKKGPTLMVGDGVNDAPALATATCGVAMGAAGTDAALEAADIALMADDLAKLVEAMRIGRRARILSRQNIVFAILVLLVLVPAGVSGLISVAVAVLVHESSELLAVANGLRAARL